MLAIVVHAGVGTWLLRAAMSKLGDLTAARTITSSYSIMPARLAGHVAVTAIAAELLIGAALMTGVNPIVSSLSAAVLLAAYAGVMGVDLYRGVRHECGCGRAGSQISWILVARNLLAAIILGGVTLTAGPAGLAQLLVGIAVVAVWPLWEALALVRRIRARSPAHG
jgi:hypothetical protein